jgi:hypothetical protein
MTLSDELKQRAQAGRQRGHGRQAFLARCSEIKQALENGYTAKEVWTLLYEKGAMPIQYRTFIDYVNRYIKDHSQQIGMSPSLLPTPKASMRKVKQRKNQLTRRFEFDAKGKSKEDLI